MARQKISDELKVAILEMPQKDKDKLLIRLVKKDDLLLEQLHYKLLEDEFDLTHRRDTIRENIERYAKAGYSWTPGLLMMEMRDFSGQITRYSKVTKDYLGEVQLYSFLVASYMRENETMLLQEAYRADKFARYVVKRMIQVVKKANKLHEDLLVELEDDLEEAMERIENYRPTKIAKVEEGLKWERE